MATACVIICGGGPNPALDQIENLIQAYKQVYFVGADRGALRLVRAGYVLDVALGDFDSVSEEERQVIEAHSQEFQAFPSEKDDTDGHLALDMAMTRWPEADYVALGFLGERGGRLDHLLANIWLAHQPRFQVGLSRLTLLEAHHKVRFLKPGHHVLAYEPCLYLSVISLTPVQGLTIQGAKYTLPATDYASPQSLISNEYKASQEPVEIAFESGLVMIFWVNQV